MLTNLCGVGSKTSVSILNEYLVGKGMTPKYECLTNQSAGTHIPTFIYVVYVGNKSAIGKGRSKQEAKHNAAKMMLEQLNICGDQQYKEDVQELVLPHENNIGYNAVGTLTDYCKKNYYPDAIYYSIGAVGPAHAKIFTQQCCVSQLSTIGEARTKKQAKQVAAHKMLRQLQDEAGEKPMVVALPKTLPNEVHNLTLSQKTIQVYQPQALLYKDYCNAYVGIHEKSETIAGILKGDIAITNDSAVQLIKKIADELVVDLKVSFLNKEGELLECSLDDIPEGSIFSESSNDSSSSSNHFSSESLSKSNPPNPKQSEITKSGFFISLELKPPICSLGSNISEGSEQLLNFIKCLSF